MGRQHLNDNDNLTAKERGVVSVNQLCHNRDKKIFKVQRITAFSYCGKTGKFPEGNMGRIEDLKFVDPFFLPQQNCNK